MLRMELRGCSNIEPHLQPILNILLRDNENPTTIKKGISLKHSKTMWLLKYHLKFQFKTISFNGNILKKTK